MALNQNDDPNFEHRLLLAFALVALLFLVIWPFINRKAALPPLATAQKQTASESAAAKPPAATPTTPVAPATEPAPKSKAPASEAARKPAPAPAKTPAVAAAAAQTVTLDTPVYHIEFSNQGGVARSWILTQYKDDSGKPLNVVDQDFSKKFGYPLAFWSSDAQLRKTLDDALYQVQQTKDAKGGQTITFTWSDGSLVATKSLSFAAGYVAEVHASVTRDGKPVGAAMAWQGAFGDRAVPGDFTTEQYFQQSGSSVETTAAKKVNNGASHDGVFQFAGVEDQYFAMAFLPQAGSADQGQPSLTVTTLKNTYQPRLVNASGDVITNKPVDTIGVAVATGGEIQSRLFVGPKKIDLLKAVDPALRGLVDFGWFTFIAEPLFLWMNWTFIHWIHNYGWAILFLTFVITMAAFPLKMKAQKSQAKMMALQPKINALNGKMKRYPMRDPRRQDVQKEIMALYSEYGVNPLGGCLPMLIQLPLIYAFWRVLEYAIELRHAPWIGYIHDLSAKDPYFLLPLLVVLSQFAMTALMPLTPGQDPRQARLMKWGMPIFVGWFFFYLPAGVNLYYLGYNVIATGQQWVANKTYNEAAVAAVAAQDRAAKSSGKKKVIEGKVVGPKS